MLFNSHIFIFYFLPAVLLLYYLCGIKNTLGHKIVLLVASYMFYGWLNLWFVPLLFASTLINFLIVPRLTSSSPKRKRFLVVTVMINLGILAFFKYVVFIQTNLNHLLDIFGAANLPILRVLLPVGVSFYTFKVISYTVDVYEANCSPERSFLDFVCYVAFFPQLLSGPIQRYGTLDKTAEQSLTFAEQIKAPLCTVNNFSYGVALFILGFAKKVLLANVISDVADAVFAAEAPLVFDTWFGAFAYSLQLYIDFSAYSEMAIGLGLMLGINCPRNFNAPYLADSITHFWRRWHLSLSNWFRDYLYIPLGGNRVSPSRSYLNLVMVFFLCGLWHGASWTFIVWGIFHGLFLVLERGLGKKTIYTVFPKPAQIFFTFLIVTIGWVFFRADTLTHAFNLLASMFGLGEISAGSQVLGADLYTREHLVTMAIGFIYIFQPIQAMDWAKNLTIIKVVLLLMLFGISVMTMYTQSFSSFLYFQF